MVNRILGQVLVWWVVCLALFSASLLLLFRFLSLWFSWALVGALLPFLGLSSGLDRFGLCRWLCWPFALILGRVGPCPLLFWPPQPLSGLPQPLWVLAGVVTPKVNPFVLLRSTSLKVFHIFLAVHMFSVGTIENCTNHAKCTCVPTSSSSPNNGKTETSLLQEKNRQFSR